MNNSQADFYIILPNSQSKSWERLMWADAVERAVLLLNNTTINNCCLEK